MSNFRFHRHAFEIGRDSARFAKKNFAFMPQFLDTFRAISFSRLFLLSYSIFHSSIFFTANSNIRIVSIFFSFFGEQMKKVTTRDEKENIQGKIVKLHPHENSNEMRSVVVLTSVQCWMV